MAQPDTKKFFENLSGAGKSIAVLTSGGDAQGIMPVTSGLECTMILNGLGLNSTTVYSDNIFWYAMAVDYGRFILWWNRT